MTDIQPMFKGSFPRVVNSVTNDMISSLRPKNIFAINTNKLTLKVVANEVKNFWLSKRRHSASRNMSITAMQ